MPGIRRIYRIMREKMKKMVIDYFSNMTTVRIPFVLVIVMLTILTASAIAGEEGVYALSHSMKNIDGVSVDLSKYQGKVLLLVNVASKCGFTPQYADLMELYKKYSDQGFMILGFPANNFRQQEPGTDAEIKEFCTLTYGVKFDMFSKISVKGNDISPLYADLTSTEKNGEFGGEIKWNFTKFLVDRKGHVVARFEPAVKPTDEQVIKAIETELAK